MVTAATAFAVYGWRKFAGQADRPWKTVARVLCCFVVIAFLFGTACLSFTESRTVQFFGGLVTSVETDAPVVALTFDDGPTPEGTEQILAILGEADVRATFFLTGGEIEAHPELAARIVAEGHEVGNHSYSHQRMIGKPLEFIRRELEETDRLIRQAGYGEEIHFRSPYGRKFIALPWVLHREGRENILWDVEPETWPEVAGNTEAIVAHVLEETGPGSIILLHVMYPENSESMEAVAGIIDGLRDRDYRFATVSELLELDE